LEQLARKPFPKQGYLFVPSYSVAVRNKKTEEAVALRATPLPRVRAVEEVPVAVAGDRVLARLIPTRYLLRPCPGEYVLFDLSSPLVFTDYADLTH
jgi:hypothetical protein